MSHEATAKGPMRGIFHRSFPACLANVVLLTVAACGDDEGESGATVPPGPASFVVQTTVQTPEGRTSIVQTLPTLELGELGGGRGIELSGAGRLFFQGDPQRIFLGSADTPEVTRYVLDPSRERLVPMPEETVSFQSAGFGFLPFANTFAASDRALLLEGTSRTGVLWNPAVPEIIDADVDLAAFEEPGFELTVNPGVVRDGLLFVPLQYNDFAALETLGATVVGVVDVETAEVIGVLRDERCIGGNTDLALADDGTILVAGDGFLGLSNLLDDGAPPTCLLRIPPTRGGDVGPAFDPDFLVPFPELLDGRQGLGLVYAGGDVAFVSAFYPDRLENDPTTDLFDALGERVSRWWRVDLAARTGEALDMPFHSLRSTVGFVDGDVVYLAAPDQGFEGRTRLFQAFVNGDPAPRELFRAAGLVTALHPLTTDPG